MVIHLNQIAGQTETLSVFFNFFYVFAGMFLFARVDLLSFILLTGQLDLFICVCVCVTQGVNHCSSLRQL